MTNDEIQKPSEEGMWVIGYGSLIFKPLPYYQFKVSGYLKGFIRRFWQSSSDHRGTPEAPGRVVTLVSLEDLKRNSKFHNDLHMYEVRGKDQETDLLSRTNSSTDLGEEDIRDITHKISKLEEDDLKVWGCAYYVGPEDVAKVKEYLDIREKDGYTTHKVPFHVLNVCDDSENANKVMQKTPKNKNGDYIIESLIYIGTIDNASFIGPEDIQKTGEKIKTSSGESGKNSEYLIELCKAVRNLDDKGRSRDYYLEDLVKLVDI
ncbi:uncharacterized protein AC631_04691 [Debaryomyces fabryi]|uniref:glutathione-specific gamma-glutamylcyclotransferase n=1 Tax=Debaryomyces fabryi TaxID=58627 RepID=A0A0V1PTH3_9ASCO|nr:uncharacterized protein AC631_04691 [Debaryomyces fabryi]KRZ99533.1 hypothetical protein AC631_04691 [Debaryomyces fabryi]CUM45547.1 unnamed protein product [Debaryomyces fabryi]